MRRSRKWSTTRSRSTTPMSPRRTLPLGSVCGAARAAGRCAELLPRAFGHDDDRVCVLLEPALEEAQEPASPSSCSGTSGISTASTSVDAIAAWHAMKPEWRPISLTTPMPLLAPVASTCAPRMTSTAAENAVSKPKLRSMKWMSLSMVFGIPTTPMSRSRRPISSTSFMAPRSVPSPPTTNRMPMPSCSSDRPSLAGPDRRATCRAPCPLRGGCRRPTRASSLIGSCAVACR